MSATGVLAADAASLAAMAIVVSVAVVDTATDVQASLDGLETVARRGQLSGIALSPGVPSGITVTAAQFAADSDAIALIAGGAGVSVTGSTAAEAVTLAASGEVSSIAVTDTAAGVQTSLDGLQNLARGGRLAGIVLSDPVTPTLDLTSAQLTADADALARIDSAFNTAVFIGGDAGDAALVLGAGVNTVVAASAAATITTGPDGSLVFLGTGTASLSLNGADTIVGGTGAASVAAPASSALVFALGGPLEFIGGSGASTVISGTSAATLFGGAGNTLLFSDGPTQYSNGGGSDTVVGLNGSLSVQGGAGGGLFFGGTAGANRIVVGDGNVTAFGAEPPICLSPPAAATRCSPVVSGRRR